MQHMYPPTPTQTLITGSQKEITWEINRAAIIVVNSVDVVGVIRQRLAAKLRLAIQAGAVGVCTIGSTSWLFNSHFLMRSLAKGQPITFYERIRY